MLKFFINSCILFLLLGGRWGDVYVTALFQIQSQLTDSEPQCDCNFFKNSKHHRKSLVTPAQVDYTVNFILYIIMFILQKKNSGLKKKKKRAIDIESASSLRICLMEESDQRLTKTKQSYWGCVFVIMTQRHPCGICV